MATAPLRRDIAAVRAVAPPDPIPGPRFRVWWKGTEVLAVKIGDEIQEWRRTDNGFRRIA